MEFYLRTDTQTDVVESIDMVKEMSIAVRDDPQKWKWLIIAIHSAVQGLMVLCLEKGNGLLTQHPRTAKKWLEAYRSDKDFPDQRLDFFLSLYKKTKSPDTHRYYRESAFDADARNDEAMERLNELRNEFIHYNPKGWSIEIALMVEACLVCLDLIQHLAFKANSFIWNDEIDLEQTKSSVETIRNNLSTIQLQIAEAEKVL